MEKDIGINCQAKASAPPPVSEGSPAPRALPRRAWGRHALSGVGQAGAGAQSRPASPSAAALSPGAGTNGRPWCLHAVIAFSRSWRPCCTAIRWAWSIATSRWVLLPRCPPRAASLPHGAASSQNVNASLFLCFPLGLFSFNLASPTCESMAVQGEQKVLLQAPCVFTEHIVFCCVIQSFWGRAWRQLPNLIIRIWSASGKHSSLCVPCILVIEGQQLWDGWHTDLSPPDDGWAAKHL